jgi:hypothetical protein
MPCEHQRIIESSNGNSSGYLKNRALGCLRDMAYAMQLKCNIYMIY